MSNTESLTQKIASTTSRRDLLLALPSAGAALTIPSIADAAEPDDPILPIYREWVDSRREWARLATQDGGGNFDTREMLALDARWNAAFDKLVAMQPTTMAGAAALVHALWDFDAPCPRGGDLLAQCQTVERQALIGLWRFATGTAGIPPGENMQPLI